MVPSLRKPVKQFQLSSATAGSVNKTIPSLNLNTQSKVDYYLYSNSFTMHIVANWKQYLSPVQEIALAKELVTGTPFPQVHQLTLLPSFLSIREITELTTNARSPIQIGAQDFATSLIPAQTGSIRADFVGADSVLIAHSERERLNHETSEDFSQKLQIALGLKKKVILCFGEKELQENDESLLLHLKKQLQVYSKLLRNEAAQVTLAYEPQWSIGGTQTASITIIKKVLALAQTFGFNHMLYGGSVDADSLKLLYFPELAGFLVGRASTDITSLQAIFATLKQLSLK